MNIPGFTAEASLYDMHAPYQAAGSGNATRGIFPAQFDEGEFPDDIGGEGIPFDRCRLCRFRCSAALRRCLRGCFPFCTPLPNA
jgi:hypothetical protein